MTEHVQSTGNDRSTYIARFEGSSQERTWLLPSNRKLRHLEGTSLRNLSLSLPPSRNRGKTTDDDSLPHALRTPTKALAQREAHKLEHSRSSNDLKSRPGLNGSIHKQKEQETLTRSPESKSRGGRQKLRRRSTLNWTNAPLETRQKKLENAVTERSADTFFSLHCSGIEEPIYVSEVIKSALNPSFRFFDLNVYGPWITRRDELTIKYWAKTRSSADFLLLIELQVSFRSLQFIGKTLDSFHHPLPHNCILFHLSDGIYTSFTDLPLDEGLSTPYKPLKSFSQPVQPTSSFDALMRLSNLDDCIQDALSVREKLSSQIASLVEEQHSSRSLITSTASAQSSLDSTNCALNTARKSLRAAQTRRSELQASLAARRAAISSGTLLQQKAQSHLSSAQANLSSRSTVHDTTKASLRGQIRRIAEDLLTIYPIEPIPTKPLHFNIRNVPLPPASLLSSSSEPAETLAAALGHAAHLTHSLSRYLSTPLPYPVTPCASSSTIADPISTSLHSAQARLFPLFSKGAVPFRFEYGVFLLNKDIETLLAKQGVKLVDQRHTAGNLRLLLSVLTAGKGEPPGRKRGVVGGLVPEGGHGGSGGGEIVGDVDEGGLAREE